MSEEKKEPAVQVKTKKAVSVVKEMENEAVFYVGPTIPGKIMRNTAFKNGIPESVSAIIEKNPFFAELFVPIGEIAGVRKQLATQNSHMDVLYNRAKRI